MHAKAGHQLSCYLQYSGMFAEGLGRCFGEQMEHIWVRLGLGHPPVGWGGEDGPAGAMGLQGGRRMAVINNIAMPTPAIGEGLHQATCEHHALSSVGQLGGFI